MSFQLELIQEIPLEVILSYDEFVTEGAYIWAPYSVLADVEQLVTGLVDAILNGWKLNEICNIVKIHDVNLKYLFD